MTFTQRCGWLRSFSFIYVCFLSLLAMGCGGGDSSTEGPIPRGPDIVSVAWLETRLNDDQVQIVDARVAPQEFEAGHIPGAVQLDPYELSAVVDGIAAQVAPPEIAYPLLSASGLHEQATIVVYGKAPEYDPTRVAWVLRYYGYANIFYLDGGWEAWQRAGLEVESGTPEPPEPGELPDLISEDLRVTGDWLLDELGEWPYDDPKIQIIDARSLGEYEAGRIPTAIHRQWAINLVDGLLLPTPDLEDLYTELDKTETTIVYCLAGWRASLSWLVLNLLGFEDVRVYDGSWFEWGQGGRFPIETGPPAPAGN